MINKFIKENVDSKYVLDASSSMLHELIKFDGLEPELYLNDGEEYPEADFNMEAFEKEMLVVANKYLKEVYDEIKSEFKGLKNIKAIGIFRPKEYNVYSDDINIDLSISQLFVANMLKYYEEVKKSNPKKFIDYLKKYYSSYEGYYSFEAVNIVDVDNILAEKSIDDKKYKHVLIQLFNYKLFDTKVLDSMDDFESYCIKHFEGQSYGEYIVEKFKNNFKNVMNENELLDLKFIKNINDFDKIDEKAENKCDDEKIKIMTKAMKDVEEAVGEKFFDFKSATCKGEDVVATVRIVNKFYKIECENINDKNPEFEIELKDEDVFEGNLKALITFVKKQIKLNENKKSINENQSYGEYLNNISDIYSVDEFLDNYIYLTNKRRGDSVTKDELIVSYYEKTFGDIFSDLDPVAFNVGSNEYESEINEAWYNTKDEKADLSEIDSIVSKIQTELDVTLDKAEINMFKGLEKLNTNKISLTSFINSKLPVDEKIKQLETAMKNAQADKYKGYILFANGVLSYVSFSNLKYKTNIPGTDL